MQTKQTPSSDIPLPQETPLSPTSGHYFLRLPKYTSPQSKIVPVPPMMASMRYTRPMASDIQLQQETTTSIHLPLNPSLCGCLPLKNKKRLRLPKSIFPSTQDCAGASHDGFHEVHKPMGSDIPLPQEPPRRSIFHSIIILSE